jgi:diguanylate cyclase (GGDEF)-like protein
VFKEKNLGLVIAIIIFLGVSISSLFIYFSFKRAISESTRSIAELSATNIYSEINNELTKPIYVALTMATDTFVVDWLIDEETSNPQEIIDYLSGIKNKFQYSSVFLISNQSLDYYRQTGYLKTINPADGHDVWYFDFINMESDYELDVDVDEANGILTVFVNVKLFDTNGNLIGVAGVGVEMDYIQVLINFFEEEYALEAFLIDRMGLVQSASETSYIEHRFIFEEEQFAIHKGTILTSFDGMIVIESQQQFIISHYIDELDWYIIIVKDTNLLLGFLRNYFFTSFIMALLVVVIVSSIVSHTVKKHQKKVNQMATKDFLTNLLNRRGFDMEYSSTKKTKTSNGIVFMADIDHFKNYNDKFGHVFGDAILRNVAKTLEDTLGLKGIISRWGGDEFSGIIIGTESDWMTILEEFRTNIAKQEELVKNGVTLSIGYTVTAFDEEIDAVLKRMDFALYVSKQLGGNRIQRFEDLPK